MKRLGYNKFALAVLFLLLIGNGAFAQELTKRVSKSFNIKKDTRIQVDNKYGNIVIKRWDKNVLDLKVTVEANSKSESKTQKILDAIDIDISDRLSSGELSIKTNIGQINGNSSFSVNYEINMPNTNPMTLNNNFGNIYMGSYEGDLDLTVKYGQLMAEDLSNAKVKVEFSSARCEIESLKSGKLDLKYSKMEIEDMGDIEISSQFSELEVETAGAVRLDGRYGNFEIEELKSLKGDIQFSGLSIEHLAEFIKLDTKHGDGIKLEHISKEFKNIEIDGQFSTININLESGTSAQLEFDLQFGNLKAHGDGINFSKVIKDHNTSEYEGYLGNSNATSWIRVSTKYGNIRFEVD